MVHKIIGIQVGRGSTVTFTFEDGTRYVRTFDCARHCVVNATTRKNSTRYILSDGTAFTADQLYDEREAAC